MSNNEELVIQERPVKLLLVEGTDDVNVCYQLLKGHQIAAVRGRDTETDDNNTIQIVGKVGIKELLKSLPQEFKVSGLTNLGIIVDADQDINACWDSVRDRLLKQGYPTVPLLPDPKGTVICDSDKPTVGVWIMPNNKLTGMLEDFCRYLIPDDDRLWEHAEDIVQKVMQIQCHFPEEHHMKAKVHTWLAWQEKPGKPLGLAILSEFLNARADDAKPFVEWIRLLYGLNSK